MNKIKQFPDYLQNEVYKELHKLYMTRAHASSAGWP